MINNLLRRWLLQVGIAIVVVPLLFAFEKDCFAQNTPSLKQAASGSSARDGKRALFRSLPLQMEQHGRSTSQGNFYLEDNAQLFHDPISLGSAEEIVMSKQKQKRLFSLYRSRIYAMQRNDRVDTLGNGIDWSERLAKRVFVYQGMTTISDFLLASSLADSYERFLETLKDINGLTKVGVKRAERGNLKVSHGREESIKNLVSLKVHLSARRGIEPRLAIKNIAALRYDVHNKRTLLEYTIDF